jgi:type I restriction enzyme S subunit
VRLSSVDKKTEDGEKTVKLCNYVDVYYNDCITKDIPFLNATASPDEIENFTLRKGDVLITKDSEEWKDIAVPAYVKTDLPGVLCGYHLAHIRPDEKIMDGEYLFRSFRAGEINHQFRIAANGITRYGIGKFWIDSSLFSVPPLAEQSAIATFLDRETARIDALIAKKERQIELLTEKRAALISHAVTKGLDPSVPMKDSGVEWLGMVPEHWEINRTKWLSTKIGSGKTPRGGAEIYQDSGILFIRSQNVQFDGLALDDVAFISPEIDADMATSRVVASDILLNITGASLGRCTLVPESLQKANVSQHVCIIRPIKEKIIPQYLNHFLSSSLTQWQIFRSEEGVSREGLNFSQIGDIVVLTPSLSDQKKISKFLDEENNQINKMMSKIQVSMEKLREYRSALISSAVTGNIDVRQEGEA